MVLMQLAYYLQNRDSSLKKRVCKLSFALGDYQAISVKKIKTLSDSYKFCSFFDDRIKIIIRQEAL